MTRCEVRRICQASGKTSPVIIIIDNEPPIDKRTGRRYYREDASLLVSMLVNNLPSGTWDALVQRMAEFYTNTYGAMKKLRGEK